MLGLCAMLAFADDAAPTLVPDPVSQGVALRQQGHLTRSIELLAQQAANAPTERDRMRATGELGASLLQARQADRAAAALREAYRFFSGPERAPYALRLGNLASMGRRHMEARGYYEEVLQLVGGDAELSLSAALNLARLAPESERLQHLATLYPKVARVADDGTRARLYLNLGSQAHVLGQPALALAYTSYDLARQLSAQAASGRLQVEALDALAQLYEDQSRSADALVLTRQAIAAAQALAPAAIGDLMVNLEWRQARLYAGLGRRDLALAAYQRAVEQVEPMRQDMPIEYDDGSSSFRRTLEPIYLGLFEGLLHAAGAQTGSSQATTLRRARDVVELIKQAEMQDYLGDRCTVDAVKGGTETVIPEGTAVLYPVILGDRLELLIETGSGITHFSTRVSGALLRRTAGLFANDLRDGAPGYMARSRQIYDWLLRPVEGFMRDQRITTLVVVPDGALRLVAVGALHDGQRFALEKFAVTTVTGLSMTNTVAPPRQAMHLLMAGVSEPGPVVDKLSQAIVDELLAPAYAAPTDLPPWPTAAPCFPPARARTQRSSTRRRTARWPCAKCLHCPESTKRSIRSAASCAVPAC